MPDSVAGAIILDGKKAKESFRSVLKAPAFSEAYGTASICDYYFFCFFTFLQDKLMPFILKVAGKGRRT